MSSKEYLESLGNILTKNLLDAKAKNKDFITAKEFYKGTDLEDVIVDDGKRGVVIDSFNLGGGN